MVAVATILLTICGIVIAVCIYGIYLGKKQEKEKIRKEREEREQFEKIVKKYMKEYESYSKERLRNERDRLQKKELGNQLGAITANIQLMTNPNPALGQTISNSRVSSNPRLVALNRLLYLKKDKS